MSARDEQNHDESAFAYSFQSVELLTRTEVDELESVISDIDPAYSVQRLPDAVDPEDQLFHQQDLLDADPAELQPTPRLNHAGDL
jgi:hypothetical protein